MSKDQKVFEKYFHAVPSAKSSVPAETMRPASKPMVWEINLDIRLYPGMKASRIVGAKFRGCDKLPAAVVEFSIRLSLMRSMVGLSIKKKIWGGDECS